MKHRLIVSLLGLMVAAGMSAQSRVGTFSLIPRVGVNIANMSKADITFETIDKDGNTVDRTIDARWKAGFAGGVDLQYQFHDRFAASVGAFYGVGGYRLPDFEAYNEDGTYGGYSGMHTSTGFIAVPLMLHAYVAEGFSINVGFQPEFLVRAKATAYESLFSYDKDGNRHYLTDEQGDIRDRKLSQDEKDHFRSTTFGIPLGVSYEYMNVVLDARYTFDLNKADKLKTLRNKAFLVTVGYKFDL